MWRLKLVWESGTDTSLLAAICASFQWKWNYLLCDVNEKNTTIAPWHECWPVTQRSTTVKSLK